MARAGRRTHRSVRLTAALLGLLLAAVVVVAAVVAGDLLLVSGAAVLAVVAGGAAYALVRRELVVVRREGAAERRDLAHSYRDLFARRADETTHREQRLRTSLGSVERRASGAEAMLVDVRRRLGEAEERFAAMQSYALSATPAEEDTVPVRVADRHPVEPEWARLEVDPVEALLAWEEHAGRAAAEEPTQLRRRA